MFLCFAAIWAVILNDDTTNEEQKRNNICSQYRRYQVTYNVHLYTSFNIYFIHSTHKYVKMPKISKYMFSQ